ncbi:MAG: hypothetical protein B6D58_00230 [candidate division Zixibacteria bacterium 4484_95]|nr:MAG: hypothetical protein B6D58_00230 [candidate division Zixibacteria bacterium 4484_95]RKX20619.1 MAG: DUF72 domain-containing protein [candidate division Zixibacteria bacterium]
MKGNIHIGTSGFSYEHWKERFYPDDVKSKEWLEYYCRFFDTVELNSTFYHLPSEKVVQSWHKRTPKDFTYAVKASRYITHRLKLVDIKEPLKIFYRRASLFKSKLGPILFQLPPSLKLNLERLESFCKFLKKGHRHVIEFRHESWHDDDVIILLRKHNICACFVSMPGLESIEEVTSDFVYVRFHGAAQLYASKYTDKQLTVWAMLFREYLNQNLDVYAYFNNDYNAYAIENALKLKEMLS